MAEERPDSHDTISVDGAGLPPRDCQEDNDKNNIIIPRSLLPLTTMNIHTWPDWEEPSHWLGNCYIINGRNNK